MWLRRAYNISTNHPNRYFVAVDPGQFYEWQYKQQIPAGTIFTKKLPPSDIFTTGFIVASAIIPDDSISKKGNKYETSCPVQANINLEIGQIQTPKEFMSRLNDLNKKLSQSIGHVKQNYKNRDFVVTQDNQVYQITGIYDESVRVANYGGLDEFISNLKDKKKDIEKEANTKKGRAYEMSDFIKFRDTINLLENTGFNTDSMRISFLVDTAQLEPINDFTISWKDCCAKFSKEGYDTINLINNYMSLSWVRDALKYS